MSSPFPKSSSSPGSGHLTAHLLPHAISALSAITYQYPLKLISPSPSSSQKSVLVFLLTYGGGLVGGDKVHLTITVQPLAKLSVVTQGHTKIFKSPSRDVVTTQTLTVKIEKGAAMCLLPDPVQPFAESVYVQEQIFTLGEGASLCLLDWVSNGRTARGENWDFFSWKGRNEIWTEGGEADEGRLLVRDNIKLEGDAAGVEGMKLKKKMRGIGLFGTLILRGPLVTSLAAFFMAEFAALPRIGARDFRSDEAVAKEDGAQVSREVAWRRARLKQEKDDGILWSAANVRGCTVVKLGARNVEGGRVWVGSMLREEGSIDKIFGGDVLMCVR